MRKGSAAAGSVVFLVIAPGMVAGVVPWWLTTGDIARRLPYSWVQSAVGWVLILAGLTVLLHAFGRFVFDGLGTPAPVAPPQRLVVSGLYRHVRNPMYLAVLSIVFGQAVIRGSGTLVVYGALLAVAFALFVRLYEEPALASQFGREYSAYRGAVPRWWPRWRAWTPDVLPRPGR